MTKVNDTAEHTVLAVTQLELSLNLDGASWKNAHVDVEEQIGKEEEVDDDADDLVIVAGRQVVKPIALLRAN